MNTTQQAVAKATKRLSADMTNLSNRRDGALSAFRQARSELMAVNDETNIKLDEFHSLMSFIQGEIASGEQMIADNSHVCAKITEIIGE